MKVLTKNEIDRFLSQPIYSWDVSTMLNGVVGYLDFSEENLLRQKKLELDLAISEGESAIFDSDNRHLASTYKSQIIEAAEYRFDVMLSQAVRYGGITSFITTIEHCATLFEKSLMRNLPKKPDKMNKQIHLLLFLNNKTNAGFRNEIEDISKLINVRNCVAHTAGLIDHYKYRDQLESSIKSLKGFKIWKDNFLGASIHIEKGAIEHYAEHATFWVPELHELSVKFGMLKV